MITGLYSILTIVLGVVAVLGPVGTIAAVIFAPAVAMPVISRLTAAFLGCKLCIVVTTIVVASVVSFWIGHHEAYRKGVNDTLAGIAREDKKWINRALEARGKLKDCQDLAKHWDQTTGRCE